MLYNDQQLPDEQQLNNLNSEYNNKLNQPENTPPPNNDELNKVLQDIYAYVCEQEQLIEQINAYVNKSRYKVSVKSLGLTQILTTVSQHKKILEGLPQISQTLHTTTPRVKNIKASIYNCCNNSAEIIRLFLWLTLLKNVFSETLQPNKLAYEQTQVLQTLFKLF